MGGGLMQLVAYGAQDIYLTGNPQITFFKVVYRRHTNFSMESIQQTINGTSTLTSSSTNGTVTISRNGDLVSKVYVTSSTSGITLGSKIVDEVEVEIGGQMIDKHYSEWNDVWDELTTPASKWTGLKSMKGDIGSSGDSASNGGVGLVQIPLNFWFCRNPGLALPLIALQYHEVKLKFKFGTSTTATGCGAAAVVQVWVDYIYLDTDERRRFAQVSHEYLIEQLQKDTFTNTAGDHKLNFNHPVKELIWITPLTNAYGNAKLVLNGHDRFASQEEEYFQLRQPYEYHTTIPNTSMPRSLILDGSKQGGHLKDIFTGTNATHTSAIESMDFADSAVTTNKVIVSQGGTDELLSGRTAAVTTGEAETEKTMIYSFLKSDLAILPVTGDIVELVMDGTETFTKADGTSGTKKVKVTQHHDGALAGGLTNANNYHLQFSEALQEPTVGDEIDGDAHFTFTSIKAHVNFGSHTSNLIKKINVYSFALKPEEHQPSGTCNFSRIDNAKLNFGTAPGATGNIYAVNYNVLRIMSGMGGLAYSN